MNKKIILVLSALMVTAALIFVYWHYSADKELEVSMFDVGAEGGEFRTGDDGLRLIIPAQAMDHVTDILVAVDNTKAKMGPHQASSSYTISGLYKFSKPVTIQLMTNAPLSGETWVALGRSAYVKSQAEWSTGFEYLPCTIKDGRVEFVFAPLPVDPSPAMVSRRSLFSPRVAYGADEPTPTDFSVEVVVITNQQSTLSSDQRFNLIASAEITPDQRQQIMTALEHSYQFFARMGFDQSYARRTGYKVGGITLVDPPGWPLDIHIKDFWFWDQSVAAFWVENCSRTDGCIELNSALIGNAADEEVWTSIIHEYFHFVQFLYNSQNECFDEATATWAEEYAWGRSPQPFNPGNYREYGTRGYQILDGPINHAGRDDREHGYASWAFVKFLVNAPEQGGELVKVYENIPRFKSSVQALNSIRPVKDWINQFYINLLTPNSPLHGYTPAVFRQPETNTPVVTLNLANPGQTETQRQTITIPGLGARVVLVRLDPANAAQLTGNTSLEVRSNHDDCTVNLIRTTNSSVLATGANVAATNMVSTLVQDSWPQQALILVTNTSEQTMTCNLDFTVKSQQGFEKWLLQRRMRDSNTGNWLGFSILLHRNEQGQYYKIEQDLRSANRPNEELRLQIDGSRVTIIDDRTSGYHDIYEGVFSPDGKSIVGTMRSVQQNTTNPRIFDYDFQAIREE